MIRAAINKSKGGSFLRAGYSANADIILDSRTKVMAIPEMVLQFEKDKTFVELEKAPNKFEKRYLKTGLSDGVNIEVLEGISKTDKIKVPQMNGMNS
jgi:HlyD family secretion protein